MSLRQLGLAERLTHVPGAARRLLSSSALCALLMAPHDEADPIRVELSIDFGGVNPTLTRSVEIARGATVVEVTRNLVPVVQDWLCCSPDDVWAIDGVGPDPRVDRYWFWTLDGKGGPDLPSRHRVADGARIGWRYGAPTLPTQLDARVVSLLPAATDIVLALGGDVGLVGLSHLCAQPEGRELPRVMSTSIDSDRWSMREIDAALGRAVTTGEALYSLDEARIEALSPTIVFSQGLCPVCAVMPEQVESTLTGAAAKCARLVVLSPHSVADIAANIREVGDTIGRGAAGRIAARAFERRFEALRALPAPAVRPRVAVLEWFEPLWASGEWIAEMVEAAGGTPVLTTAKDASRRVTWDELVAADPDVIVLAACSMSIERTLREVPLLAESAAWSTLRAVRAGRVFVMDGERHFSTPGPRIAEGAEHLARLLRDTDAAEDPSAWRRVSNE
jgi:iron complex transport system substrate-binding protein